MNWLLYLLQSHNNTASITSSIVRVVSWTCHTFYNMTKIILIIIIKIIVIIITLLLFLNYIHNKSVISIHVLSIKINDCGDGKFYA